MIVFMLGVPGCGKSEVYRRLTKKLEDNRLFNDFPRVDDFPKLWSIFMEDEKTGEWKRCRATDDGGYKVTDDNVWDDILKEVNKEVMEMIDKDIPDQLIFVEFSRPNYVHSINSNFSKEILLDAVAVYLDVPFDICWDRNVRRHEKAVDSGTDDHLVSREEMEKTYGSDDKDQLDNGLSFPVIKINPDSPIEGDVEKLNQEVEKAYQELIKIKGTN